MTETQLISALESVLFASGEALSVTRLSKILGSKPNEIESAIAKLMEMCLADENRGLFVIRKNDTVELATKGENARYVEALVTGAREEMLSKAALEVLSVVAYRAPIGKTDIDAIRGVNGNFTLRNLLLRGLIERSGNSHDARGYMYAPTFRFLETLGIANVQALPEYEILSKDERMNTLMVTHSESLSPTQNAVRIVADEPEDGGALPSGGSGGENGVPVSEKNDSEKSE